SAVERNAISVVRPLKFWPNSWNWGRRLNEAICRFTVQRAVRRLGFRSPLLWINDQSTSHLVGKLKESAVTYDITDHWTCLTQSAGARARVVEADMELCRRADTVIVC